ncbi:hypothetical protein WN55_03703, partial [Dufourea novaeangliae]
LQIVVLVFGVCGALAIPATPWVDPNQEKQSEMVYSQLPGSENLNEKAVPPTKLLDQGHQSIVPERPDSVVNVEAPLELPGTKNLAEKRIPVLVLQKLYRPPEVKGTV